MKILKALRRLLSKPDDNGFEHLVKCDGILAFVFAVRENGQSITLCGWDDDHWKYEEGQRVLVVPQKGNPGRYRITKAKHCGDPPDMYFLECDYFPRQKATPQPSP